MEEKSLRLSGESGGRVPLAKPEEVVGPIRDDEPCPLCEELAIGLDDEGESRAGGAILA